ncbi:hypothetical protein B0H34DRAFT_668922 [Crassisporium funariophilum]|nr:hypothetical protein B0H34DRAFT_668922 [Crassisporium funariophilum]
MPHKKAKRSIREKVRNEKGSELAPGEQSLRNEAIPKSAARVFNAQTTRDEWKLKKRKLEDGDDGEPSGKRRKTSGNEGTGSKKGQSGKKVSLTIQPGESMQHFNRRVEDDLRPLVKSAVQASHAVTRNVIKAEMEARAQEKKAKQSKLKSAVTEKDSKPTRDSPPPPPEIDKHAGRPKEFQTVSSSTPRRLNDIAQAPPELKKLPRGAGSVTGKRDGVLSMSQKLLMEEERTKAIARYRELKARRQHGDRGDKEAEDE